MGNNLSFLCTKREVARFVIPYDHIRNEMKAVMADGCLHRNDLFGCLQ